MTSSTSKVLNEHLYDPSSGSPLEKPGALPTT
ncbi:hypothetical protein COLO4_35907 [Corchorus olitorius]|uniref:Uncharacterized protein n=1 Tax=Corchorus olitorius TaxID=93759 RepID=A0A1R3GC27_9ROSI|nr:hypothetical protein COLO4_35907 [Corchorus olitorius]